MIKQYAFLTPLILGNTLLMSMTPNNTLSIFLIDLIALIGFTVASTGINFSVANFIASVKALTSENWLDAVPYRSQEDRNRYAQFKRIAEVTIILLVSPVLVPLMALVAAVIYLQDGRAVFFVQERTGYQGKRFKMFKFRTMVPDAEERLKDLAAEGLAVLDENGKLAQPLKLARDPRVTTIGRILRKTSLDELPQLLNVLRGEMSIVGPRPTSWDLSCYNEEQKARLCVLPGITGLWQVFDRGSKDFDSWVEWDMKYINGMSLIMDVQIIIRTVMVVLKRREIVQPQTAATNVTEIKMSSKSSSIAA